MSTELQDIRGTVFVGGTLTALARIVDWQNDALVQSGVTSIHYTITNPAGSAVTGHNNVSLTVSAVVYNSLQTVGLWTTDTTGYNFAHTIDISSNAAFAAAGRYTLQYNIVPASGQLIIVRYSITVF